MTLSEAPSVAEANHGKAGSQNGNLLRSPQSGSESSGGGGGKCGGHIPVPPTLWAACIYSLSVFRGHLLQGAHRPLFERGSQWPVTVLSVNV